MYINSPARDVQRPRRTVYLEMQATKKMGRPKCLGRPTKMRCARVDLAAASDFHHGNHRVRDRLVNLEAWNQLFDKCHLLFAKVAVGHSHFDR